MMKKIYNVSKHPVRLAGYGQRDYGEYFEVDNVTANHLLKRDIFSEKDPRETKAISKIKKTDSEVSYGSSHNSDGS